MALAYCNRGLAHSRRATSIPPLPIHQGAGARPENFGRLLHAGVDRDREKQPRRRIADSSQAIVSIPRTRSLLHARLRQVEQGNLDGALDDLKNSARSLPAIMTPTMPASISG